MPDAHPSVTPSRAEAAAKAAMPPVRGARRSVTAAEGGAMRSARESIV